MTAGLVVAVLAVDLLWGLTGVSMGSIAYGLVDLPAHLATCAIALLTLAAIRGEAAPRRFAIAALVASVAIDLDHVPGYLGDHVLTGTLPRPYSHTALLVVALVALGLATRRPRLGSVSLGIAFGVGAHLFRDLATGPGVPLAWPVSSGVATMAYALFAGALVLAAIAVAASRRPARVGRLGLTAAVAALAIVLASAAPAPTAEARTVSIGAYIAGADRDPRLLDAYARQVGREPAIVNIYKDWGNPVFERQQLMSFWRRGAVTMITLEPWGASMKAIARGRYDRYVEASARAAARWGRPVMLRFAHEMNGNWYPWGIATAARTYKAAWRHIVRIYRVEGARNVQWVWAPYASLRYSFRSRFPGNRWVDWVGLDGFNWGGSLPWESFKKIFAPSYRILGSMSPEPMIIAETGSSETGGSKAKWLATALNRMIPQMPRLRALVWYSVANSRGDFRVNSSRVALRVLRRALRQPRYRLGRGALVRRAKDQRALTGAEQRQLSPSARWREILQRLVGGLQAHF